MKFGWQVVDGAYRYFDPRGIMVRGWLTLNGKTYYLDENGAMKAGWLTVDGNTYYLNASGEVQYGWQLLGGQYYYFDASGAMRTGWVLDDGKYYYLNSRGHMMSGWQVVDGKTYYLNASGVMQVGWQNIRGKQYFFNASGEMQTGWLKQGALTFYLNEEGVMQAGWQVIDGKYYYFNASGVMQTGWVLVGGKYYYLNENGEQQYGWQLIDGKYYYLNASGEMQSGLKKIGMYWYYLNASGVMQVGWQQIGSYWYFFNASGIMQTGWQTQSSGTYYLDGDGRMVTGWREISGDLYYFYSSGVMARDTYVDGKYLNSEGKYVQAVDTGKKTVKNLLQIALEPVGQTLYVWAGGHDVGTGGDGVRIGVNPQWKRWFDENDSSYDWTANRYKYGYGLDCSGFVGWAVYNVMNTKSNQSAYMSTSTVMPSYLANLGFGTYYGNTSQAEFTPGDIVSQPGHVWIVLGQCSDGSAVIVHSTPPGGVQISGTVTPSGSRDSEAVALARKYMNKYYPEFVDKFGTTTAGSAYMKNVNRMQWKVNGSRYMSDPEGITRMSAEEVLEYLFGE